MASDKDAMVRVRPLAPEDRSWTARALERVWGSTTVARKGQLVDARALDGFVALTATNRSALSPTRCAATSSRS